MSYRSANLLAFLGIAMVCFIVQRSVSDIPTQIPDDVGTGFFPGMIAWLTIGLCAAGAIKTVFSGPGGLFLVEQGRRVAITFGIVVIFVLSWKTFGFFYVQEFVFLFALISIFRIPLGLSAKKVALSAGVALCITSICYLVFNQLIYVDL